jgi:hypothetical protein
MKLPAYKGRRSRIIDFLDHHANQSACKINS